jgi:two-component system, NtrC family, response regulator AtoC
MPGPSRSQGDHASESLTETALDAEDDGVGAAVALGKVYLVCHRDEGVELISLDRGATATFGRDPDVEIRIDSPRVSRRHARVALQDGELFVEDLGSRNGTRVNRDVVRSARRRIVGGDVLKVGPLEVVVARADAAVETGESRARLEARPSAPPPSAVGEALVGEGIVVADPAMVELFGVIRRLSAVPSPVLILGETGAGKEIVAEQIHRLSPRARGPFVRLNCASLPDNLLESELFGHERGAFTGADRQRIGYFEAAHTGTLLLDEIGEMPLALQAKLLRVLEQGRIVRLGATKDHAVDTRILCATHRDLAADVQSGRFRQDLFYRISTFTLRVPPLRDRPTEIELLAALMVRRVAAKAGLKPSSITPAASEILLTHSWPGNVRELRNVMEHAVVMAGGDPIEPRHLPEELRSGSAVSAPPAMRTQLADAERASIEAALVAEGQNRTHAARRLGISRRALIYKMIKYGLRD